MTRTRRMVLAASAAAALVWASVTPAVAASAVPGIQHSPSSSGAQGRNCPPAAVAVAVGFSDGLDKVVFDGVAVGGLSGIAVDRRSNGYVAVEDHSDNDPARLFFLRDPAHPRVTGVLVLRHPDGTPYDANSFDGEGIAVLPDGRFLVSSETEPSIRIFGRDGKQAGQLDVPARLAVAPAGQATANATLEGLSISPSGRYVYAAMEGTLSGDIPAGGGEGRFRRILVYTADRAAPGGFRLVRQIGYQVDAGNRIAEVAAYGDGRLVVLEAAFTANIGNTVRLYAVTGADQAPDVSGVASLSAAPAGDIVAKRQIADLVRCPTLGATAKEPQRNPLLDNYEGLAVGAPAAGHGPASLLLVSDDNFSATQTTRLLSLAALLP